MKKIYITSPIYYASGSPHIGHAYTTILGDVIARYKRLLGHEVFFQTGMDEHGQKIQENALKANLDPQEYVDKIADEFEKLWKDLGIEYQSFIRTSNPDHKKVVQDIFEDLIKKDVIELGNWEGLYCVGCEENYSDTRAVEKGGKLYCEIGHELVLKKEESYFFKMSKPSNWIKEFYEENPNIIFPENRKKELINNFVKNGLEDLSVSRTSFDWGIKVKSNEKHVIYVWIDALLNYLTGLGYKTDNDENYQQYWANKDTIKIHLMSKEITRFHCIYWPILLNELGLNMPTKIISHGWIITKEGKMSKSLGNVIDPKKYIKDYGSDALRYYLMKKIPASTDGIFDHQMFVELYNSDLANIYGNTVSRTLGMLEKYSNNKVPKKPKEFKNLYIKEKFNTIHSVVDSIVKTIQNIESCPDINLLIIQLLAGEKTEMFGSVLRHANKAVEDIKPWELKKEKKDDELNEFLFFMVEAIRIATFFLQPILVEGTKKAIEQMGFSRFMTLESIQNKKYLGGNEIKKTEAIYQRK